MKHVAFFITMSILCSYSLIAQWIHIGLADRSIKDIACGKDAIFAVTVDSGSVYRSTDLGTTWNIVFPSAVVSIATSANGTVFLDKCSLPPTPDTIFSSTDHGSSWTTSLIAPLYGIDYPYTLTFSPNGTIFCYNQTPYIYRSTDVGQSWDTISIFEGHWSGVFYLGFFQDGSVIIDKGINFWGGFSVRFLSISSDNGTTWNGNGAMIGGTIAIDHKDRIYFTNKPNWGEWGIFRSDDLGLTSEKISEIIPKCILPLPSGVILAGTNDGGIFLFGEDGDSLGTLNEGLTNLNIHTLALDSLGYVYAGTDSGVYGIGPDTILTPTSVQHIYAGWNLLSLPIHPIDHNKETNYPGALSDAFEYCGNYKACQELSACKGYWLKIGSDSYFPLWGEKIYKDSVCVDIGWNMIGSLSESFPDSTITSEPASLVTSSFWEYDGTQYITSDMINPGKGYWVKVSQSGKLYMSTSGGESAMNKIRIVSTGEQPPTPPDGEIQNQIKEVPKQFALIQNYPNPFNPSTEIRYQLPEISYVTLKIYNLLGQEVATLMNETQEAGYKSVKWNAQGIPSGVYFCRLTAGSYVNTKKLVLIR